MSQNETINKPNRIIFWGTKKHESLNVLTVHVG